MSRDIDDDLDRPSSPLQPLGPLDKMFRDTNIVMLVIFALCCGIVAFVLGVVCLATAKDPKAKKNAIIVVAVNLGFAAVVTLMYVVLFVLAAAGGAMNAPQ